jgi:hypothetical protein
VGETYRAHDGCLPVEQVVADGAGGARRRRVAAAGLAGGRGSRWGAGIPAKVGQLLVDSLEGHGGSDGQGDGREGRTMEEADGGGYLLGVDGGVEVWSGVGVVERRWQAEAEAAAEEAVETPLEAEKRGSRRSWLATP